MIHIVNCVNMKRWIRIIKFIINRDRVIFYNYHSPRRNWIGHFRSGKLNRHSYCFFKVIQSRNNWNSHVTSVKFDEPKGKKSHHHLTALAIHGYQGKAPIVFLCGKNERYKGKINCSLQEQGFYIKKVPLNIAGTNNKNIVNDN